MVAEIIISVLIAIFLFLLWVVIYDTNRFTVSNYEYTDNRIKKKKRAVVLSDLHNNSFGPDNRRLIEAIDKQKPDLILIAGDIINGTKRENTSVAVKLMKQLSARYPVFYGNGNHEMRVDLYREDYGDRYDEYVSALREAGVHHLVNESAVFEDSGICIIGSQIDKRHYLRHGITPMDDGELEADLGQLNSEYYNILIAHNPDYFENYVQYGPQLVLSGHIHGGIIRVPFVNKGVLSPNVSFFPKYDAGEFVKDGTTMVVSRGLGAHTIPVRLFNPGDLVVIDFNPANEI